LAVCGGADLACRRRDGGFIGAAAADGQDTLVADRLKALEMILPGRVYIELQRHGLPPEQRAEPLLLEIALKTGLPLVATNDCRFETRDMEMPHDVLVCIGAGRRIAEEDRTRYSPEHYFKSAAEMKALFADVPEAVRNTVVIAQRCSVVAEMRAPILPTFTSEAGRSEPEELKSQAKTGLASRLERHVFTVDMNEDARGKAATPYLERLAFELDVINQMGFPRLFPDCCGFYPVGKAAVYSGGAGTRVRCRVGCGDGHCR
jgi:DNA polymerase-3 subunit alpha